MRNEWVVEKRGRDLESRRLSELKKETERERERNRDVENDCVREY